jgi:hypothetical protein
LQVKDDATQRLAENSKIDKKRRVSDRLGVRMHEMMKEFQILIIYFSIFIFNL